MKTRRQAGFTMIELLVAATISSALGLIIYGIASQQLIDFARNTSINRSYSNARQAMERIAVAMQSAGSTPILVDASGADSTASASAGIRFWRCTATSSYYVTTPSSLTATTLTISLIQPGTTSTVLTPPVIGDVITVAGLAFQAQVTGVSTSGNNATLTFSGALTANTNPVITAATLTQAGTDAAKSVGGKMTCLDWTPVAFIAINSQLRYFPRFVSGTTSVSTPANYKVLTYLTDTVQATTPPPPFSLGPTPSVNVDLYAEAPDYNNRDQPIAGTNNFSNGVGSANTYTQLQCALAPRCAAILR